MYILTSQYTFTCSTCIYNTTNMYFTGYNEPYTCTYLIQKCTNVVIMFF